MALSIYISAQRPSTASYCKVGSSNPTVYLRSSSTHSTTKSKVHAYTKPKRVRKKRASHSVLIDTSNESSDESLNESSNEGSSETFTGLFDGSATFEETLETLDLEDGLETD